MNKVLGIRFKGNNNIYHYLTNRAVRLGQFVVVDSPFGGYTCVEIFSITWLELVAIKCVKYKSIVDVVDDEDYLNNTLAPKKTLLQEVLSLFSKK